MQKWEYLWFRAVTLRGQSMYATNRGGMKQFQPGETENDIIARLGAEGWELVAVDDGTYHFKRPLESK